jgi:hypothetical protein
MLHTSSHWKLVFWSGFATFGIGAIAGLVAERSEYDSLYYLFLGGVFVGSITLLVSYIALALFVRASSAIAGGAISLLLAFFVSISFEHWGGSVNIHVNSGVVFMFFGTVAALGGLLSLAIGIVRMASSPE